MATNPYESPENPSRPLPQKSQWPSLVNVVTLVAILGLLVAMLLPFGRGTGAREAARRMQCSNHLHNIGLALQNYHDDYKTFPPAFIADASGQPIHSWRVLLLPYLEQKALYEKYDFNEPWNGPNNSKLHNEVVQIFSCPSRSERQPKTHTSYVAVVGPETAWPGKDPASMNSFKDGTSNAILVVETAVSGIHWMEPRDLDFAQIPMTVNSKDGQGISSDHPTAALALFADGHTQSLTTNTPAEILQRLLTIADGEPIGDF